MAFRIAEMRQEIAETTNRDGRISLQKDFDALILNLWTQRALLPDGVGATRRVKGSLELLQGFLEASQNPYRPRPPSKGDALPEIIAALHEGFGELVRLAMTLLYEREAIALGPEDPDLPLDEEDRALRARFAELREMYLRRAQAGSGRFQIETVTPEAAVAVFEKGVAAQLDIFAKRIEQLRAGLLPKTVKPVPRRKRPANKR